MIRTINNLLTNKTAVNMIGLIIFLVVSIFVYFDQKNGFDLMFLILVIVLLILVILFKISKNQCKKNLLFVSKLLTVVVLFLFRFGVSQDEIEQVKCFLLGFMVGELLKYNSGDKIVKQSILIQRIVLIIIILVYFSFLLEEMVIPILFYCVIKYKSNRIRNERQIYSKRLDVPQKDLDEKIYDPGSNEKKVMLILEEKDMDESQQQRIEKINYENDNQSNIHQGSNDQQKMGDVKMFQLDLYKSLIKSFPDGILLLNHKKQVVFFNYEIRRILKTKEKNQALKKIESLINCNVNMKEELIEFEKYLKFKDDRIEEEESESHEQEHNEQQEPSQSQIMWSMSHLQQKDNREQSQSQSLSQNQQIQEEDEQEDPQSHYSSNSNMSSKENNNQNQINKSYNNNNNNNNNNDQNQNQISQQESNLNFIQDSVGLMKVCDDSNQNQISISIQNNSKNQSLGFSDEYDLNQSYISHYSQNQKVREQIDKILSEMTQQQQKSNNTTQSKNITFTTETKILCQFPHPNQSSSSSAINKNPIFQLSIKPFYREGKPYILLLMRDVTMFNHIQMLQTINNNKQRMLEQVAHEFRSPLNNIVNYGLSVQGMINDEIYKYHIQPIIYNSSALLKLVTDLLDVSQLKVGKFKLNYTEFNLHEKMKEIVLEMRMLCNKKNIEVLLQIDPQISQFITSDDVRLRQIIINLVGNSIKFTENGRIIVSVSPTTKKQLINISVSDNGCGISQENQKNLFQAFGKLEENSNMNPSGVGLGLMISNLLAKKLCVKRGYPESQTGLEVFSDGKDHGAKFHFHVYDNSITSNSQDQNEQQLQRQLPSPIYYNQDKKQENNQLNLFKNKMPEKPQSIEFPDIELEFNDLKSNEDQQKIKSPQYSIKIMQSVPIVQLQPCSCQQILIVDDILFNVEALFFYLKSRKYRADMALSGQEAIQKVKQFKRCSSICSTVNYRIILMDIQMPKMSGMQTSEKISQYLIEKYGRNTNCLIWALSGNSDEEEKRSAKSHGMSQYFVKGVNTRELYNKIKEELDNYIQDA